MWPSCHQISAWCLKRAPVLIFVLALLVRLAVIFTTKTYLTIEHTEVINVATSLATHGTFADAYGPTGPTAHTSPLYPILLSLIFRLFGTGVPGEIVKEVSSSAIASLLYAALPILSTACGLGLATGVVAGVGGALVPVNFWAETKGSFEAPLAGLVLVLFCIASARTWRSKDFSMRSALIVGSISGVGLLLSPNFAPITLTTLFLGYVLSGRANTKLYIRFVAIVLGIVVLCLTPWTIRNYVVLGGPVWARSNLGLELYIANNDIASANVSVNYMSHLFHRAHPLASAAERAKVRTMGELPYEHEKLATAEQWIKTHPRRFMVLTIQRMGYFWFPRMVRPAQTMLMGLFTVGAVAGLIRFLRSGNATAWLFLGVLISYSLIYYLVVPQPRYRYPVDWVLIFLTSFWICSSRYFLSLVGVLVSYSVIYYLVVPQPRYRYPIDWLLIFLTLFWMCSSRYFLRLERKVCNPVP